MTVRRRTAALIGAVVIALVGVVVAAVQLTGDRSSAGDSSGPSRPDEDDRSPEASELAGLLEDGLEVTYHARYESAIADPRAKGTLMTMDVWRKGKLTRQELAVKNGDSRSRSTTFQLAKETVQCNQVDEAGWTCGPPSETKPGGSPLAALEAEFANEATTVRSESVGGVASRCFTFPGSELTEACLTEEGVLARLVTSTSSFQLIAFSRDVPDTVFTVPASS